MYSESEDFKEKQAAYNDMMATIGHYNGQMSISIALEIGGSGGLLSGLLCNAGTKVICTDVVNLQVQYGGEFPRLLREKFQRNGLDLDLSKIEFHTADAQDLIYGNEKFDLVFSLNAFEHIPDPLTAIDEAYRVLRHGGVFYASFDPVWTADSGSHFMHYTTEPWLHLLTDEVGFRERMISAGAAAWEINEFPSAMNRLPASFYKTQVKQHLNALFTENEMSEWSGCVSSGDTEHANRFTAAEKNGWNPSDLLIRGFRIFAVK